MRQPRGHDGGRRPPEEGIAALDCIRPGYNVTSCVVTGLLEWVRTKQGEEAKLSKFSREVTVRLKDFRIQTELILRYLEALDRELRSQFPLVLRLTVETETPLAVHLRNPYMPLEIGLAWHPIFNAPYIPATALKGALKAGTRRGACGLPPAELFGHAGREGALVITDALPTSSVAVEPDVITPHYREPDVVREDAAKPTPIVFPVIRPGATFDFFVASRSLEVRCAEEVYGLIKEALAEGLGAKTRVGYGVVRLK
ncbi:MAG: type III-B CRISPR module RAMP protein Cmr6 [Thermoproteaceae archaeon]|nr:type III-B CRISPR module RAMP protein Cmr6 [Thermoproteaceae archaeon]